MVLRWLLATLHLLALPLGLAAIWIRSRALASVRGPADLPRVFRADNLWAVAAGLWIVTGVWRLLAGVEKSTAYYLQDHSFYVKMGLFLVILLLEIWPMTMLIRWRLALRKGQPVATGTARTFARISLVQAALVLLMVFAATAMARGLFY